MMAGLAAEHGEKTTAMINATYLKAHQTAALSRVQRRYRLCFDRHDSYEASLAQFDWLSQTVRPTWDTLAVTATE
ncbi:hypothetical protein SAMN04488093_10848 [Tropicibacter naphthalenivorans]|uniref:Uncharacterized protein n=1 Tax=Tropicibacter naphthalenivorans TaxID=441103 RepID=A0A0P1GGX8_9RHOB|nr:hypothetical protein TRN7648_03344 [Tropicibacter naphthalenivorans]SMC97462.1 hypothetical protein SAMN04488093_10848 [Tropicibacter naphthalenivorans]